MPRQERNPASADEPAWPESPNQGPVLFLLDASSGFERELLLDWIERARPAEWEASKDRWATIPPTRRRRSGQRVQDLEAALATDGDPLLTPLRVAWLPGLKDGVRSVRLSDLLTFGDPRDPGALRQRWVRRRFPDRMRIVLGEPAPASELRHRWAEACEHNEGATTGLPEFVVRQACLALERAERRLRGNRYKVPRLVAEEILSSPSFKGNLSQLAREAKRSEADVNREAAGYLREIAATHSPFVIDIASHLIRLLYKQGYAESLEYDHEQLAGIASLAQRAPVVFLPTHKSNLDHLVLQYMLHENGLPPNHTAGGINMNFFPIGPLVRRSGTFFIRRSFRDNAVYKYVLGSYIDYLIDKRFSLEWYIEGGRSRSGKLLPPRFGMLSYVVDAFRRGKSDDVFLIPVSIAYDQIQDVNAYVSEERGEQKEKEGLGWFIKVIRSLRSRYGKIHIRFGEPLSLRDQLETTIPGAGDDADERHLALQKLAFEVSVRINHSTPITPTSLVTLALLGSGDRALTLSGIRLRLVNLLDYVASRKLPTSAEFHQLESDDGVLQTLEGLEITGVVSRYDGGPECVYMIGAKQQLAASYYRNTVIHFFVNLGIIELSLLAVAEDPSSDPVERFWNETLRLRDLLKFEFFFADKDAYAIELRRELGHLAHDWEDQLANGQARALTEASRPFMAHRVLRPFLEGYQVVSDRLQLCDPAKPFNEPIFLPGCLGLGQQYLLQRKIHSASSVSKTLFETVLKLARNRGLLDGDASELAISRREFSEEIQDALRRVDAISALAASRRAGLIP